MASLLLKNSIHFTENQQLRSYNNETRNKYYTVGSVAVIRSKERERGGGADRQNENDLYKVCNIDQ